jgi:hypothetical protein
MIKLFITYLWNWGFWGWGVNPHTPDPTHLSLKVLNSIRCWSQSTSNVFPQPYLIIVNKSICQIIGRHCRADTWHGQGHWIRWKDKMKGFFQNWPHFKGVVRNGVGLETWIWRGSSVSFLREIGCEVDGSWMVIFSTNQLLVNTKHMISITWLAQVYGEIYGHNWSIS